MNFLYYIPIILGLNSSTFLKRFAGPYRFNHKWGGWDWGVGGGGCTTDGDMVAFLSSWSQQQQMHYFYFSMFSGSFGGIAARAGQRAEGKHVGFVGTTAGRNWPGSRFTSLKAQHEGSRAFRALPTLLIATPPSCLLLHTHMHTPSFTDLAWSVNWKHKTFFMSLQLAGLLK